MVKVKRYFVQIASAVIGNSYIKGFWENTIYRGDLKKLCFPGLNCYSCPGALGSCPIGSMQSIAADLKFKFSFYVVGYLFLIGTLVGRMVCGWVCPFGFIQELLYKIPFKKFHIPKIFNLFKYLILLVFVILLPVVLVNDAGFGSPYFCKWICPAGTLEAGIPLGLGNEGLRSTLGWLFQWKLGILIAVILLAIMSRRPFCRTMCPLGAIYSFFNRFSFYQMEVDSGKCTKCGICTKNCPVDHTIYEKPNGMECIRCGECKKKCPTKAIKSYMASYDLDDIGGKKKRDSLEKSFKV